MKGLLKSNLFNLLIVFSFLLFNQQIVAQSNVKLENVQLENRWTKERINNQTRKIAVSKTEQGWWSAQWTFEPVKGTEFIRIKNRWTNEYIHNQTRKLAVGSIQLGWWSAMWTVEKVQGSNYVRFQNRWTKEYIHNQNGKIGIGKIQPGWWSAMWTVYLPIGTAADGDVVVNTIKKGMSMVVGEGVVDAAETVGNGVKDGAEAVGKVATDGAKEVEKVAKDIENFFTGRSQGYIVSIDCNHSDLENETTANMVTVSFLDIKGNLIDRETKNGIGACWNADTDFKIITDKTVKYIEFSINGGDAYYIDEFRFYKDGKVIMHEGRDNGSGWCLSTDANDGKGAWAGKVAGGTCRSKFRFTVK